MPGSNIVPAVFQPTLPARGATLCYERPAITDWISTHAPRTGSDGLSLIFFFRLRNFNPRSPHGERPIGFRAKKAGGT